MKIKAIKAYNDLHENKSVKKDEVYETTAERAKLIVEKGFAVFVEEKAKPKKKVKEAK